MIHICRYRTLALNTYFCPVCRQLVYRGRVMVLPMMSHEELVALRLQLEHAISLIAQGMAAFQAVAELIPLVSDVRPEFIDRLRRDLARPAWQQRVRFGPRYRVRAVRGARRFRSQRIYTLNVLWSLRPTRRAQIELRKLGIAWKNLL